MPDWNVVLPLALGSAAILLLEWYRRLGRVTSVEPAVDGASFDSPGATPLEKSIRQVTAHPTGEGRRQVCSEFARSLLYAASPGPAAVRVDDSGRPLQLMETVLTTIGPHGEALLVFTSEDELRRRSPGAHPIALNAEAVYDLVCLQGLSGVVVNPAGPWVFLSKDEVGAPVQREAR